MIIPKKTYLWVAAMLFVLLVLTIAMAYVDLGPFNIIVAMTIAIVKAVLVVLFFMHVRYSSKVTWVFASAGFFWLLILFILTMSDYATR
jgi:cytochrome c oxidase subunit IV